MQRTPENTRRYSQLWLGWLVLVLLPAIACAASVAVDREGVARVLTLLTVVGEEYREGCDQGGTLVRPLEYEEARSFLAEARLRWGQLENAGSAAEISQQLAVLNTAIEARTAADSVLAQVAALRTAVTRATGIDAEVYPPAPPSPSRGAAVFREYCVSCHGERGDGRGPDAAQLDRKPANFTDKTFMRGETPYDHFHVVTLGKRGAAMPAWGDVLTLQERWDVLSYVWRLAHDPRELAEGQGVYLSHCADCHGGIGDGTGAYASTLLTPVPNLAATPALARRTDTELFAIVRDGVAGTAMPSFRDLTDDERWKAVAFLRSLSFNGSTDGSGALPAGGGTERFGRLLRLLATEYRNAVTDGQVVHTQDWTESDVLLGQVTAAAPAIANALKSTAPAFAAELPQRIDALASSIHRRATADEVTGFAESIAAALPAAPPPAAPDALADTRRLLAAALAAYPGNDLQAVSLVSDAYFQFEPFEAKLAGVAPDLKARVEQRFLELRGALAQPGADERAAATVAAINGDLDAVVAALQPRANVYSLFVQSATIILREGFEIVLVITALLAYVKKSGQSQMRRPIVFGATLGVGLSLITAYVFAQLFRGASTSAAETLGGVSMLLASVVLFWVSYWLVSKAEADRWQRYIQGKVKSALSTGSGVALVGAAFLAVFREGVETVLFYEALFGSAQGAAGVAVGGLIAGTIGLAVLSVVLQRFGMKIPIRRFFLGTSVLLYYMAIVFAGQGVAELQETGWISVTPIAGVPRIDFLGVYPTMETVVAQSVLLVLLAYALIVIGRQRAKAETRSASPTDEVLIEVRNLHRLAVEIRGDLAQQQPTQAGQRLETLIECAAVLEGQMQLGLPTRGRVPRVDQ